MIRGRLPVALVALLVASITGIASLSGCGRHVVLDPETVDLANQRMWLVKSEPRRMPPSATDAGPPP